MWLYLLAVLTLAWADFIPTNDWQLVSSDINIPAGLDVQLDMESGNRYARLPQHEPADVEDFAVAVHSRSANDKLEPIHDKLNAFEDLVHDIDHGEEIMRTHFNALNSLAQSADPEADRAAKIIQAALRHNQAAIKTVLEQHPSYPKQLVGDLSSISWRKLGIFGSLVSTPEGANACYLYLENIRKNLNEFSWNAKISKRLETILEDLKHMEFPLDGWTSSLQLAITQEGNKNQLFQLKTLVNVMEVNPFTPTQEFMHWLSDLASPHPGNHDIPGDLVDYVKSVRHVVFGNKHAERLKSDL